MTKEPKITVCITTQKSDLFYKRAVDSVLMQTVKPFEVIIVIDGLSAARGHEFKKPVLPPDWSVYWTEAENSGPAIPKNIALHYSTGEWILCLDGDDLIVPTCLEHYTKMIPQVKVDVIAEFTSSSLLHNNFVVTKNIPPDKDSWENYYKYSVKTLFSGSWKRGEFPLRPLLIKAEGKKFFPHDFGYMEDKMICLYYILEERRIYVSDYCSYIVNIHPGSMTSLLTKWGQNTHPDFARFKRCAGNININGWIVKDKIFDLYRTFSFLSSADFEYIDKTIKYFSFL